MGASHSGDDRDAKTTYPAFVGIEANICCRSVAAAEVAVTSRHSCLITVSQPFSVFSNDDNYFNVVGRGRMNVSLEGRHYFGRRKHTGEFVSARLGTSRNVGASVGYKAPGFFIFGGTLVVGGHWSHERRSLQGHWGFQMALGGGEEKEEEE